MGYTPLELIGDGLFVKLSDTTGIDLAQVRYVAALLLQLPLAGLMRFLAHTPRWTKHVYSLLCGLQILWFLYGINTWHSLFSSLVVYLVMRYLPQRWSYRVGIAWSMAYIFISHVYRMYQDYMSWTPDWTAPQMVLSIKMTSYCFAMHDHYRETEEKATLSPRQKVYAIGEQPSLLAFLGWTYFFPGLLAGPATEYTDYARYIDLSMFKGLPNNGAIPNGTIRVLRLTLRSLFFMGCVAVFGAWGPERVRTLVADPVEAAKRSVWINFALMYAACVFQRCKYYLAWTMGEASCIASGEGFTGIDPKTGEVSWERAVNCKPLATELSASVKVSIDIWNIATERWLRHYVYERLEGGRFHDWRKAATFTTSAFWHGLYPGYYFTFISASLHVHVAGMARKKLRPRVYALPAKWHAPAIYDVLTTLLTISSLTYCMTCFMMLTLHDAFGIWWNTYFIGHWPPILGLFLLRFIPTPKPKPQ